MTAPARAPEQRKQDSLRRLEHDVDAWVATADGGTPHMIPLSFLWDSGTLVISTPASSPTSRNLIATGKVRGCGSDARSGPHREHLRRRCPRPM